MSSRLSDIARRALASSSFEEFGQALQRQSLAYSFGILESEQVATVLEEQLGTADAGDWVLRPSTWDSAAYDPRAVLQPAEILLHLLWQDLSGRLARKLESTAQHAAMASQGAILCFFGRAALGIVVAFKRSVRGAVSLRPIAAIRKPRAVFDVSGLLATASPDQRNAIKKAVHSVDKLVFQRGVLVHVDRQREDVFGPAIDTVLLGELVAEWLAEQPEDASIRALEVGSGNGLLSSIVGRAESCGHLVAIDVNEQAVVCTLKNLRINGVSLKALQPQVSVRGESFRPDGLAPPFDLVVCNPPYVPNPPTGAAGDPGYQLGVSDIALCRDLLSSLDSLLADGGRLLLMTSSVSSAEILAQIPNGFRVAQAVGEDGYSVPFDIDSVWERKEWLDQLASEGRVESDASGTVHHTLRPLWIGREE